MKNVFAQVLDKLWYILGVIIILMALLVSIARLMTPVLMEHRADFEKIASDLLKMPVMIRQIEITWHQYAPEISLEGITIIDPKTQAPRLMMDRMEIDFNIWRSLLARKAFIESITVTGVELTIHYKATGELQIGSLAAFNTQDTLTGQSIQTDNIFDWVFSQPQLALQNIRVRYIEPNYPTRSVTLKLLILKNTATHHVIDGKATLNQEVPVNVTVHLGWDGDIRKLPDANGHVYLYIEDLSLPQWFSKMAWNGLTVTQGLVSTKIWIRWNQSKIYKIQDAFEIYDLELYSSVQKRTEIFNRLKGNLGWLFDGKRQVFAGDQIFVDFLDHKWPATKFEAIATPDVNGVLSFNALNSVSFSYVDLADAKRLALMLAMLPDTWRQNLNALNPSGVVQDFQVDLPPNPTDMQNISFQGKLSDININPWQNFPGITHFSAEANWDGKEGQVTLNSKNTILAMEQFFINPIYFADLSGAIKVVRDGNGLWSFNTHNIHVDNADMAADVNLALTMSPNASPTMDLATHFMVKNAARLAHYLPEKIFDPTFVKWLHGAFLSGQISDGAAIVQGKLSDFPFDTASNGKFLIKTKLQNLDFNFAPDWPHIKHLNGDLNFAGRTMMIDIHSGMLLDVPLKNVHGTIPYIGDKQPQIVNVNCEIDNQLGSGLNFIRNSPLQKTIGKDLAAMELKGPMLLKLALSIPVRKPEQSKVTGDLTLEDTTLTLPAWHLALDKINGALRFTEAGMEAPNLQAQLFSAPTTFSITTLHPLNQAAQVKVNLGGNISLAMLQSWLKIDMSKFVTGSTNYQAQMLLSSGNAATNQMTITTDLKGIGLNLPNPYGKSAAESKNFQIVIDLSESKLLRIKFLYANLLSAALSLQKANQALQFHSVDLRLGDMNAAWQTSPGILISGEVPELNVAMWKDYFDSLKTNKDMQPANLKLLREIDLSTNLLDVLGVQLHNAQVELAVAANGWNIQIASTEIGGSFLLPFNLKQVIVGHFDHIYMNAGMFGKKDHSFNPRLVPPMLLDMADVRYEAMKFGHVNLDIVPDPAGLSVRSLRMDEPNLHLDATGQWTASGSHLQGSIATPHFSDALKDWGFNSASLVSTTGDIDFNLNWATPIFAPELQSLSGTVGIKLGEGKIIHLSESTNSKIGLGRLLNIFSLTSIPRHLKGDFNDMSEGYAFDNMRGDFTLKDGNAFTDNMRIEGTVASLDIKGRIGLQAKDLDLKLGILAHVTGSLPIVAAAIAGGPFVGPVIGVATWLVGRAMSHEVARVTSYDYSVTGTWQNPTWQKLR